MTTTKKLKWLLALVLVFGGFTVYRLFEGLVHNPSYQEYEWIFKIISDPNLACSSLLSFLSVIFITGLSRLKSIKKPKLVYETP